MYRLQVIITKSKIKNGNTVFPIGIQRGRVCLFTDTVFRLCISKRMLSNFAVSHCRDNQEHHRLEVTENTKEIICLLVVL